MKPNFYLRSALTALMLLFFIQINVSSNTVKIAYNLNSVLESLGSGTTVNKEGSGPVAWMSYNFYCCDLCASILSKTDINCYGGSNGQATATGTGGTKPYSYHWSNGQNVNPVTNLIAGTYIVTVSDCNGCTSTISVCITQPSALTAGIASKTNINCSGGTFGAATVTASGGTLNYSYKWSTTPQQTTATAVNLTTGTYSVTVTDAHGCTASAQTTISVVMQCPVVVHTTFTTFNSSANCGTATSLWLNIHTVLTGQLTTNGDYILLAGGTITATNITCNPLINNTPFPDGKIIADNTVSAPKTTFDGTMWITRVPLAYSSSDIFISGAILNSSNGFVANTGKSTTISGYWYSNINTFSSTWFYGLACYQPQFAYTSIDGENEVYPIATGGYKAGTPSTQISHLVSGGSGTGCSNYTGDYSSTNTYTICPPVLTIIIAKTHVSCFGANTGSASVSASGGIIPYHYTWSTSPVQTTQSVTGLVAGTYTVTVTDSWSCTSAIASVAITQPATSLTAGINSKINVVCYGANTGSATATAAGGTTPYIYKWSTSPQQTTATATNLIAGTYTVTVTDAHGCPAIAQTVITQPGSSLMAGISSHADVTCFGLANGSATVTASGGLLNYTYKWSTSPQQNTSTATNLIAGTYTVTVTDANGCTDTDQATITQPTSALTALISSITNISCFGASNGSATVTAVGGTPGYQYKWSTSPQQVTVTAINLSAGTYTVTVTDAHGCTASAQTTLSVITPCPVVVHTVFTTFNSSANCGTATTLWLNIHTVLTGQLTTNGDFILLTGGTITLTNITCNPLINNTPFPDGKIIADNTVSAPKTTFDGTMWITRVPLAYSSSDIFISGAILNSSNGFVANTGKSTTISGYWYSNISSFSSTWYYGLACYQPQFAYTSIDGENEVYPIATGGYKAGTPSTQISHLVSGGSGTGCSNYTGDYSCTTTYTICPPALTAIISAKTHVNCFGGFTGSATVSASGGTIPYHYSWSTSPVQTTQTVTGLVAGTYTVTVTDSWSCTSATASVTITQPTTTFLLAISAQTNVKCFGGNSGAATVSASGGTIPYAYKWSTSPQQTTVTAINLAIGTYTVTVTDAHGCIAITQTVITQPVVILAGILSHTDLICNGANNGIITVTASGGTAPYKYTWNTGVTGNPLTGLAAGTYTVTVTDVNNCIPSIASATITQPAAILASILNHTDLLCNGDHNGIITATAIGGTAPYKYTWNTGVTGNPLTGLAAGTYTVTVTDINNCTPSIASATITQPAAILASILNHTDLLCNGDHNGIITATAIGGTAPYKYTWNTGVTGNPLTGLAAGTYTVTVTDVNNCTPSIASATITQPAAILASILNHTDLLCNGDHNGIITATAIGGTAPYKYTWNTGVTGNPLTGLAAGTYTVTVTDVNNCTPSVASATITQPAAILASILNHTDLLCNGNHNGIITATAIGGTAPYKFTWNTGVTGNPLTGLAAGTYTVIVTDVNNCTPSVASATITQPTAILASILSHTDLLCNGDHNGIITATAIGGTAPYKYTWNTSVTGNPLTGLAAGTYTVTVTDVNNCTPSVTSATITQPAAILASILSHTDLLCNGDHNGIITATAIGGTAPYKYTWNTGVTGNPLTGLAAGTYTVTVTDVNNCTPSIASATITQPAAILASILNHTDLLCNGNHNGIITATAIGGTAPYKYTWNTGVTGNPLTGLAAGTYTVTVTDVNNCTPSVASATITQPAAILASILNHTDLLCNGNHNGIITATAIGGTAPYKYTWNTGVTGNPLTGLAAGTYTVTVTDVNNCTPSVASATITQPAAILASILNHTDLLCNGDHNGIITATAIGGTAPYKYTWNTGVTGNPLTGLAAGTYTVTVTDVNNCTPSVASATITQPAAILASILNHTDLLCNGDHNGIITTTAIGGTAPYKYTWNTGVTGNPLTGLAAGTYTVTVTDVNNCTPSVASATITQPAAILASIMNHTDLLCNGDHNGIITATAIGGTAPYKYTWNTGVTGNPLTGLAAGTYTVTVTDVNNCTPSVASATITQPAAILASILNHTDLLCNGDHNGIITATAIGGTSPYKYTWNTGVTGNPLTGLASGTYTVTVTDVNNCTPSVASATITQPAAILASILNHTDLLCNGDHNGIITATAIGGTAPYKYTWNTGVTGNPLTGLAAGTYTVTVTDVNNCTPSVASATITQPAAILASILSHTDLLCNGDHNGIITATAIGGTAPYKYTWNTGVTGNPLTGLAAGTYTVTVTDVNNCTPSIASATITQPAAILASILNHTDLLCNGNHNGIITATAIGGTAPYKYTWNTGVTGNPLTGLAAGTYTVTVTDVNNCTPSIASATITQPAAILASILNHTDLLCNGNHNGIITATAIGGTAPYKYTWNTGVTGNPLTGLASGTYTVTVTDVNNCTPSVASATITQPAAILASILNHTDLLCNGNHNGIITATAIGGTAPYKYTWNTGVTGNPLTGLAAGTYTVTVTDVNNCTPSVASATITQPAAILASILNHTDLLCNGDHNGIITATAIGGTAPYKYTWNTGVTGNPLTGLAAGTYTVTVTDVNNCSPSVASATITQPAAILASILNHTDLLCNGNHNGIITATAIGGTAPYKYTWNTGVTGNPLTGLAAGTYTVTVTDVNNCTPSVASATITQPAAILASILNHTDLLCNGDHNGIITATAIGGTAPYKYTWNTGVTGNPLTGLAAGTYTVTVTDVNNCTPSVASATITQPSAILASILNHTDLLCNGDHNGIITATAIGGTAPYKYTWNTGVTGNPLTGLAAGTYTVTVTDVNNCTPSVASATITQPAAILASILNHTDLLCNGDHNGIITATAIGGTAPYKYTWNTGVTGNPLTGLAAGTYTVTVTDVNNCTPSVASATITQPAAILASILNHSDLLCNGDHNGIITATAIGGTAPYKYTWNTGVTGNPLTGLAAGTYTVTVTDVNNCTPSVASATITQPAAILASILNHTDLLCNGDHNGIITATAIGGTAPYKYTWNTGVTGNPLTGLAAGTYTVTVTDVNNCTPSVASATITQPSAILASILNHTDLLCNGDHNGIITATAIGGTAPYKYTWNTGVTGNPLTGLAAGTYTVTVTDVNNCTPSVASATITQPAAILASILNHTDLLCNGDHNGIITATAIGGTAPYKYTWNTGVTGNPLTGLASGTYTVTVTDVNNCTPSVASATITQPAAILASILSHTDLLCNGDHNGIITATAIGGIAPYKYTWNTGVTGNPLTGLAAGTYTVTVTDVNNCTPSIASATITQPAAILASILNHSDLLCNGDQNGSITATATGGTVPYKYVWNTGATVNPLTGLTAGTYTVTVYDVNLCNSLAQATLTQPSLPLLSAITSRTNVTCYGLTDGSATVTATGGTPAYTYTWSTSPPQTTVTAGNLGSGTYTVTVTDAHGCTTLAITVITQPVLLTATVTSTPVLCFQGTEGTATVSAAGGNGGYNYNWSTVPAATTQTITGLSAGTYSVTVTDSKGCSTSAMTTITQPTPINIALAITNVQCYGGSNGGIYTTVTGGIAPYIYKWSNGSTEDDLIGISAGTYTVTVTNFAGCPTTALATLTQPGERRVCIIGPDLLCQGATGSYCLCTGNHEQGDTYQWTVIGGTIINGCCDTCITIVWNHCDTGTVCILITQPNGCIITSCLKVTLKPTPVPDLNGPSIVNAGEEGTFYCTSYYPGHLYSWSVINGTITNGQGSNCIAVTWNDNCGNCEGQVIVYESLNGCCGTDTINVTIIPGIGNLNGYVIYNNPYGTGLNGVTVTLKNSSGVVIRTTHTGPDPNNSDQPGYYTFPGVPNGSYHISASFGGAWGGNNATDALIIELYTVNLYPLNGIKLKAADVTNDFMVNATDALWVKLRTVGMVTSYPAGDWVFTDTTFVLYSAAEVTLNALCTGDVNGSYIPSGLKKSPFLTYADDGIMTVPVNKVFTYLIRSEMKSDIGAMTLFLGFDQDLFEVEDVTTVADGMKYVIEDGRIKLAWSNTTPLSVGENDPVITLKMKVKEKVIVPVQVFDLKPGCEFADKDAVRYDNFGLRMSSIVTEENPMGFSINNFPNPFRNTTDIMYSLPEKGHVTLTVNSLYGETICSLVNSDQAAGTYTVKVDPLINGLNPGVYLYKITVDGETATFIKTNKMIFTR